MKSQSINEARDEALGWGIRPNLGPIKVNQRMAFFGLKFENLENEILV